jgi:hypothetical protein
MNSPGWSATLLRRQTNCAIWKSAARRESHCHEHTIPSTGIVHWPVIPAEAGIQRIEHLPRKRNNIMVLSASRGVFSYWIPAFAGMTG